MAMMMTTKMLRTLVLGTLLVALAACGKKEEPKAADPKADPKAGGKTEGGRELLDPTKECGKYFDANQKNGDRAQFVAACTKDMSLVACTGAAAGSGFCTRANEDAAKKQIIADMKAALEK